MPTSERPEPGRPPSERPPSERPQSGRSATERQRSELLERLTPLVGELGFDVDDIVVTRVGRRIQVRVTIDSDHGVGVDDMAQVSRVLDEALDQHDPFAAPFVLEVSSPGVDRPLTSAKHWQRNVGRLVRAEHDGQPVTGRIVAADAVHVVLSVDEQTQRLPLAELGPGHVQVEFNRATVAAAEPTERTAQTKER